MKKSVVRWCVGAVAALLALLPASFAQAQSGDPAPALVVTIGPADALLKDIGYLTKTAGQAQAGGFLQIMAGQYLAPMDRERPAGVYMSLDTGMPVPAAFLPVADFDGFVSMIADQVGVDPEIDGDMTIIAMNGGEDLYLIQQGDWTYASNQPDALSNLPNDPMDLIEGLEDYDIAVRVFGQNVPGPMKAMAIDAMRGGFEDALRNLPPEQAEMQREIQGRNLENLANLITELDELTVGLAIDQEAGELRLDMIATALDGSVMAESANNQVGAVSSFLGFLSDNAAVSMNGVSRLGDDQIAQATQSFDSLFSAFVRQMEDEGSMSDEELDIAKGILDTFQSSLEATVESGKMDFGFQMLLDADNASISGGGYFLETDKIEAKVKELVALARQEAPPGVQFNLDVIKENGINWHEIVIPVPDDQDEAYQIFGDSVSIWLGVADEAIYFSAGKNAQEAVLEAIADSESAQQTEGRNFEMNADIGKIVEFAGTQEPSAAMVADMLGDLEPTISLYGDVVENGSRTRLVIREDVIKAIGQITAQFGGGGANF
ncbi:MAG: hypothetical protein KDA83_15825 [Planctomycetales bacterium]|nr:hypothetical protein [Planctomycetales bacterium]